MINLYQTQKSNLIRRYIIVGYRRFSNYWWTIIIFLGAAGFLLTGISSYQKFDLLPFITSKNVQFFPQGLVMCFYGLFGLIFSFFLAFTLFWNVGEGFNEFNKKDGIVRIFRWGFPGKNRRIDLFYFIDDINAIKVEFKQGFNPRRTISLSLKGKRNIPLTRIGQPLTLQEIEKQASELAKFLQVSLQET
uniref:Photosystem I assembly protein Ycf4 n=1 Tax=Prasiolopsis wulf-kochii TaxID=3239232 RepID=A0A097KK35_9CHLO|nr:hypothetical chloroplast RF4 [Prasiolopsis sp. SAG 84.81]